jgi:hypothetical protein
MESDKGGRNMKKWILPLSIVVIIVLYLYIQSNPSVLGYLLGDNPFRFHWGVREIYELSNGLDELTVQQVECNANQEEISDRDRIYSDGISVRGDSVPEELIIWDKSIPDRPKVTTTISFHETKSPEAWTEVGPFIYLFTGEQLFIVDTSASNPELSETDIKYEFGAQKASIVGNWIFVTNTTGELMLIDVTALQKPVLLQTIPAFYEKYYFDEVDKYQNYLVISDNDSLHFVDISNFEQPREVGVFKLTSTFFFTYGDNVTIVGDLALLTEGYHRGIDPIVVNHLTVVDISNPAHPRQVTTYADWNDKSILGESADQVVLADMGTIIDFSTPSQPKVRSRFSVGQKRFIDVYPFIGENGWFYFIHGGNICSLQINSQK